jgi:methylthioribose-1-phosphate isomerase
MPSSINTNKSTFFTLRLASDAIHVLDQRALPREQRILKITTPDDMIGAIQDMSVRGAPAIGVAGAFGIVLSARGHRHLERGRLIEAVQNDAEWIREARPTAVNLMWAVDRMLIALEKLSAQADFDNDDIVRELEYEAQAIYDEDIATCNAIGEAGKHVIPSGSSVITCCNTGSLATAGYGTALGVIRSAWAEHKSLRVIPCETRPRLQGAKLTTWELQQDGIPFTLISDNMAAVVMRDGLPGAGPIACVIAGADRIAANGDSANKIGTYSLACLAKTHGIPFYIAAPLSTVDFNCPSGGDIPIEERAKEEMTHMGEIPITPDEITVYNPAFDVTPAELITGIITEKGLVTPENLKTLQG